MKKNILKLSILLIISILLCVSNTFGQSGKAGITVSKATTKPALKVALFAADAREVGSWGDRANLSGIGRENATRAMIEFMQKHADEELVIVNVGTVGSPAFPVGTVLGISEIISGGAMFLPAPMRLECFDTPAAAQLPRAVLYSSDCFVSPDVYTSAYLDSVKLHAQCFDMESSALYSVAKTYNVKYYAFKIVSDNLDVPFSVWEERVGSLSQTLTAYLSRLFAELGQTYDIVFVR